jgi:hypothetical protein
MWGQMYINMQKNAIELLYHTIHENVLEMDVVAKNKKLSEENMRINLCILGLGKAPVTF